MKISCEDPHTNSPTQSYRFGKIGDSQRKVGALCFTPYILFGFVGRSQRVC